MQRSNLLIFACLIASTSSPPTLAQPAATPRTDILSADEWWKISESANRGLRFLAAEQAPDGSIPTLNHAQPGVTALAVLAFLQQGHVPGQGPYGKTLDRAIRFILSTQQPNGIFAKVAPAGAIRRTPMQHEFGVALTYNHGIASLAISENYGMLGGVDQQIREPLQKALDACLAIQRFKKSRAVDRGGWRYYHPYNERQSDLSIVGWHLKFLRSAKNVGFDVPESSIEAAVGFVLRCFNHDFSTFEYEIGDRDTRSRAMAGVGILSLAHSSKHNRQEALLAANWILNQDFQAYNRQIVYGHPSVYQHDRYHYSAFYCTQAMYQMGGRHWEQFYPQIATVLMANQNRNGSWDVESAHDASFGHGYTTSLAVLALGAPNQLLPIYQR